MSVSYGGDSITFADSSTIASGFTGFKNRIINGAMVIDQRNAGASVTPTSADVYVLDRWNCTRTQSSKYSVQQNAASVTPPAGFSNYQGITSLSAYSLLAGDYFAILQPVEGYNIADLAWGTASAATVTLSFWVRSSLTGTFGGVLKNSAANRSYPFTYAISVANTWEQKSITVAGDTSGTWLTTNGIGIVISFGLGVGTTFSGTAGAWAAGNFVSATGATSVVGTNGATFYITGVQLERGSTASSFEYRPYGTELALCQRYYFKSQGSLADIFGAGFNESTTLGRISVFFPISMRTEPTALEQSGTASDYSMLYSGAGAGTCSSVPVFSQASTNSALIGFTVASGLTAGQGSMGRQATANAYLAWSAEL